MLLEIAYQRGGGGTLFFTDYPNNKIQDTDIVIKKIFIKTTEVCFFSLPFITTLKCELGVMLITGDCLSAKIVSSN